MTLITLKIKMPTKQHDIEIDEAGSVTQLRNIVAQTVSKEPSQLVLIFGGKILKDEDTLATHSIQNGHSVHLVIKNQRQESKPEAKPEPTAATAPTSTPAAPPQPAAPSTNPFAGLAGMGGSGMGGLLGGAGMNEQMQQLMNNPELMNQLMDSPVMQNMMQSILDNPQLLQEMIRANPQMNQVMEQNPDLAHIFNNPSLIRQAMEMHRNPSMMQEMMRHQDRAMSNIENLPGGFQALERMYRDIQEPMMNATNRPNQYQSNTTDNAGSTSNQAGRQNTEALPNPWGGGATNTQQNNAERSATSNQSNPASGAGAGGFGGLGGMNPAMMQSTMEMMRNNPELMRSLMQTMNPQLANNPQMSRMMENYISNPEMSNPAVLQALQQIQSGYETIRREAPRFWESFGAGMDNNMQQMMQRMGTGLSTGGGVPAAPTPAPDAETRFAEQLSQLEMMGFTNKSANIEELTRTGGNVEAAVDRLLQRPR